MPPKKVPAKAAPRAAAPKGKPAAGAAKKSGSKGSVVKKSPSVDSKKSASGSSNDKTKKPVKKEPTKQDLAAIKIQALIRGFLGRKALERKKKAKEEYEETMERLEKEAYVQVVKMYQEQAEKERQKEEEERRKIRENNKRKKRMLEAAFDGDLDDITAVLKEVEQVDIKDGLGNDVIGKAKKNKHQLDMVDCEDANENTPLSEAASGGNINVIKLLVEKGANINSQGHFKRTPLYRAAFAGHLDAVEMLLEYGADPRIYADDGQTPEQIASLAGVREVLGSWDIEQTEMLLEKLETELERRKEEEKERRDAEMTQKYRGNVKTRKKILLDDKVKEAEKEYKIRQKQMAKMQEELNKRIFEHDSAASEGFDKPEITLQAIHDAESELEIARLEAEKSRDLLAEVRLERREQQAENADEDVPGIKILIRELDEVLMKDVGNKISESGKWPLIIDPSQQAATFLRYRDTNYLNSLSPKLMVPDTIRLAILGGLRYGKPVIMDMMHIDMFEQIKTRFDEVQDGLLNSIMDKSILKPEKYEKLIKEGDGDMYDKNKFMDHMTQMFRFFLVTQNPFPPEELLDQTYPIRIYVPNV